MSRDCAEIADGLWRKLLARDTSVHPAAEIMSVVDGDWLLDGRIDLTEDEEAFLVALVARFDAQNAITAGEFPAYRGTR